MFVEHKTSLDLFLMPLVMTIVKDVVRSLILDVLWRTDLSVRNEFFSDSKWMLDYINLIT